MKNGYIKIEYYFMSTRLFCHFMTAPSILFLKRIKNQNIKIEINPSKIKYLFFGNPHPQLMRHCFCASGYKVQIQNWIHIHLKYSVKFIEL